MKFFILLLTLLFFNSPLFASNQKLMNGAGTMPSGLVGLSFDLGLDVPEPIFYGVRADFGLGDRVQLGVGGSFFVAANSFGVFSLFNVAKSKAEDHFLSFYLNPSVLHFSNLFAEEDAGTTHIFIFLLNPGVAYEHRFGLEKKSGVYLKLGTMHLIGISGGGTFFDGFGSDTTSLQITPGFQHHFEKWSVTLQGVSYIYLDRRMQSNNRSDRFGFGAKLGFTSFF